MKRAAGLVALFAALACGLLLVFIGPTEPSRAAPGDPSGGPLAATQAPASSSCLGAPVVSERLVDPVPVSFLLKREIWVHAYPRALAVGDFNRDGCKDLAVLNSSPATVSILLGLGNGNFSVRRSFPVPKSANAITVADLNHDRKRDLIIGVGSSWGPDGSYRPHAVSVLLGMGDGTFAVSRTYGFGYSEMSSSGVAPAVVDLNGDGKLDIVSAEGHKLIVLLGRGDGSFSAARAYSVGVYTGGGIVSLALGRLNGDHTPDAVVGKVYEANEPTGDLSVLLGRSNGGFRAARTEDTRFLLPRALAVADLNHDGKQDLVVAYDVEADLENYPQEYPAVAVSLGKGDGTFAEAAGYDFGRDGVSALNLADFNGDGDLDLLVTFGDGVRLLLGNRDGSFQPAVQLDTTRRLHGAWLAVADFSNDSKPDFAVLGSNGRHLDVYLSTSGATE